MEFGAGKMGQKFNISSVRRRRRPTTCLSLVVPRRNERLDGTFISFQPASQPVGCCKQALGSMDTTTANCMIIQLILLVRLPAPNSGADHSARRPTGWLSVAEAEADERIYANVAAAAAIAAQSFKDN